MVISMELDKKWELKRTDITLGARLGGGNYGEVYQGTYLGQVCAAPAVAGVAHHLYLFSPRWAADGGHQDH